MIEVSGLVKRYGPVTAIEGVTFSVGSGEVFGLLGPNGAGKTTTMRIICCVIPPDAGSVVVAGVDALREPSRAKQSIGYLPEVPSVYGRLTVRENLEFFARLYGVPGGEVGPRVSRLLRFFSLEGRADQLASRLSRGLRQRLAIARALVHDPPVLLLDEPTSGLDPMSAREVRDLVVRVAREEGKTVLLSTHNLFEAEQVCDRVAIIRRTILAVGRPRELAERASIRVPVRVALANPSEGLVRVALSVQGVTSAKLESGELVAELEGDPDSVVPELSAALVEAGAKILSIRRTSSLEEAFISVVRGGPRGRSRSGGGVGEGPDVDARTAEGSGEGVVRA